MRCSVESTENAIPENGGAKNKRTENAGLKIQDECQEWKLQDLKMRDQMLGMENTGPENAGPENEDRKMEDQLPEADYLF